MGFVRTCLAPLIQRQGGTPTVAQLASGLEASFPDGPVTGVQVNSGRAS